MLRRLKPRIGQRNTLVFALIGALKAIQAAKTTSPLVRQCQQMLNDASAQHAVGLYWVPGHAGVRRNEIADRLARSWSGQRFIGPEPFFGVSIDRILGGS